MGREQKPHAAQHVDDADVLLARQRRLGGLDDPLLQISWLIGMNHRPRGHKRPKAEVFHVDCNG